MMVADGMTRHVLVGTLRMLVIGIAQFVNIEHFACMDGAVAAHMGNCWHDEDAEKQPDHNQQ